ncbi:MAG: hypothetical protein WD894_06205 [Pirellulales bacterium]
MARIYAGILGLLAFAAVMARGIVHGGAPGAIIWQAVASLFAFAALGYAIGRTAQWVIDDSVRGQLTSQLQNKPSNPAERKTTKETAIAQ